MIWYVRDNKFIAFAIALSVMASLNSSFTRNYSRKKELYPLIWYLFSIEYPKLKALATNIESLFLPQFFFSGTVNDNRYEQQEKIWFQRMRSSFHFGFEKKENVSLRARGCADKPATGQWNNSKRFFNILTQLTTEGRLTFLLSSILSTRYDSL